MKYWWRQLRWQIVAAQMVVVVVGVVTLLVTADALILPTIAPDLLPLVRAAVNQALVVAAGAATLVGLLTSLLLMRQILRPLHDLARSARRIAAGQYDERVALPSSDELADVAGSFNQMAQALSEVEQQRVALIGIVAHELRTPLAGLEGYLEGLVDGVLPQEPETFRVMQHDMRRLRRLVDDLQQLSRVEAGQLILHITEIDPVLVVQRVVTQLRPQMLERQVELLGVQPGRLLATADSDRLAQILFNLIGNAIRYTRASDRIGIMVDADAAWVRVAVTDSGVGIPAEALPYVFERFYRVDPSRSRSSGGSGIGLTIARRLARAMGGDIHAASPGPGRGSTFTLRLPRVSQNPT